MYKILFLLASAVVTGSCGGNAQKNVADSSRPTKQSVLVPDMHTAETSLDYVGTYKGTFPAADGPGIEVRLTLRPDGHYDQHLKYIDRGSEFDEKGEYTVEGNLLILKEKNDISYYKVEENRLRRLDADRQSICGPLAARYILQKTN